MIATDACKPWQLQKKGTIYISTNNLHQHEPATAYYVCDVRV